MHSASKPFPFHARLKFGGFTNLTYGVVGHALRLVPPWKMSMEQCLEFLADDELLEVTPKNLRIRKTILNHERRMKAQHGKKN